MKRRMMLLYGLAVLAVGKTEARGRIRLGGRALAHGAKYSGPTLSREQLAQCVSLQDRVNAGAGELDQIEASLKTDQQEVEKLEAHVLERKQRVDVYSKQSVDNFNALVAKHRKLVQAYNAKLPAFNARVSQSKSAAEEFNTQCANHAYYASDMEAVIASK